MATKVSSKNLIENLERLVNLFVKNFQNKLINQNNGLLDEKKFMRMEELKHSLIAQSIPNILNESRSQTTDIKEFEKLSYKLLDEVLRYYIKDFNEILY